MTTETRPWLQDESADPALRELLESTEFDGPSDRQLEKLTARVAFLFDLPPGGGEGAGGGGGGGGPSAPAAPAGGAATVAATSGVVKAIVAAGVISVGAVVATVTQREPVAPPAPVVVAPPPVIATAPVIPPEEPVAPPPEVVEPAKPPPPPVVRPAVVRQPTPTPPPAEAKAAPPPPSSPDAELTALDDAIAAARAGRPAQALAAVEAHVASWPDSPLAQEREVIAIEALLSLGRRDDARARLTAFRSKWPTSTHLVRLESMLPQ